MHARRVSKSRAFVNSAWNPALFLAAGSGDCKACGSQHHLLATWALSPQLGFQSRLCEGVLHPHPLRLSRQQVPCALDYPTGKRALRITVPRISYQYSQNGTFQNLLKVLNVDCQTTALNLPKKPHMKSMTNLSDHKKKNRKAYLVGIFFNDLRSQALWILCIII